MAARGLPGAGRPAGDLTVVTLRGEPAVAARTVAG